jgi:Zn-dependent protease
MFIISIVISWLVLVIAITVHEFAHAWMGEKLGDPTARLAGRLTLNPIAHLDMIGTVLLPFFTLISGSPIFIGWAKPTPFDPYNLKNPKKDAGLIALAGPVSNLLFATILALFIRLSIPGMFGVIIYSLFSLLIRVNVVLAFFNLIPVHPLDGFKVVGALLPKKYYADWISLERYGMIFLLLLIFPFFGSSPVFNLISPIVNFITSILLPGRMGGII